MDDKSNTLLFFSVNIAHFLYLDKHMHFMQLLKTSTMAGT